MPRRSFPAAFATCSVVFALLAPASALAAADDGLDLHGERFRVTVEWRTPDGTSGIGHPVPSTQQSGFFWFFSPDNLELMVKVLDACAMSQHYWFFAAGTTDVEVTLTVEDRSTGQVRRYQRAGGALFAPIADTAIFSCSPTAPSCGHGNRADILASPRSDPTAEALALVLGNNVAADEALYQRLHADLEAIRASDPEVADLTFWNVVWGPSQGVLVGFSPQAWPAVQAGTYHDWDCLDAWYRGSVAHVFSSIRYVSIHFAGSLRWNHVPPDYRALPGVVAAEMDAMAYAGCEGCLPNYGLCAMSADGVAYDYFVDEEWRRPSRQEVVRYFRVTTPGAPPTLIGRWSPEEPHPTWKPQLDECYRRLNVLLQR